MFSLGVVRYELLAGRRPFKGENGVQVLEAILRQDPPPLERRDDPRLAAVERVIRRMLAKDPAERSGRPERDRPCWTWRSRRSVEESGSARTNRSRATAPRRRTRSKGKRTRRSPSSSARRGF